MLGVTVIQEVNQSAQTLISLIECNSKASTQHRFSLTNIKAKGSCYCVEVPRHEDVWGNGDIAPLEIFMYFQKTVTTKIQFTNKLRGSQIWGILASIQFKFFIFPSPVLKT
jgi:hypothetical protein